MASIDLKNDIKQLSAFDIQAITTDTTTVGNEIDTLGFESVTFILQAGTLTDGDYTILVQDSDVSGSGFVDVTDDFLIGTEAATQVSASNAITRIGYVGKKRYVKISVVSANTTSGGTVGAIAALGSPRHAVVA